jgi:hypothetical protein
MSLHEKRYVKCDIAKKKKGAIADGYARFMLIIKIGNSASQKHPALGNPEGNSRSGIDTSPEFEQIQYFVVFASHNYHTLRWTEPGTWSRKMIQWMARRERYLQQKPQQATGNKNR